MRRFVVAIILIAGVFISRPAAASPCERTAFGGTNYVVCSVDAAKPGLRLFWRNAEKAPHETFSNVADAVAREGHTLIFALNAGMYSPEFSPAGLYVEDGVEMRPANTDEAPASSRPVPNFFKKPNGVFFIAGSTAKIVTTEDYVASRPNPQFATQSGPTLVIRNTLHPAFIQGSTDRTRRSGVGVCDGHLVRFAVSEDDVNFYDFATLFRDQLKCPDALFLDGGRGVGLYDPAMKRNDVSGHGGYGPIFGLVE